MVPVIFVVLSDPLPSCNWELRKDTLLGSVYIHRGTKPGAKWCQQPARAGIPGIVQCVFP